MKIVKYLLLSSLCLFLVTASDPFFGIDLSLKPIPKESPEDVRASTWISTDAFRTYLDDSDDRVSDIFMVRPYFYPSVNFWFMIYTQFASSSVVVHDKANLGIIYKVLDFSNLYVKDLPRNTIYVLQQKLSSEMAKDLKKELEALEKDPFSLTPSAKSIYRILKQAKVSIPLPKKERIQFFSKLKSNVRTQTGQKDYIHDGMIRSLPYQKFLNTYFADRELPIELLAVPFLESSFNPRAYSRVNALGIWQFMPLIASYYLPKRSLTVDYRSNVGVSSLSAASLMADNFRILKTWDLTVTAYNSGTKHLLKTKRSLASGDVDLEDIIMNSDSQHFGFASKNFYSEFLALAHVIAYKEELFPDIHDSERADVDEMLRFYLAKCSLKLNSILSKDQMEDVSFHNDHISEKRLNIGRGTIITSKSELPKSKFLEIEYEKLIKYRPKDWNRFLNRHSCSTR